MIVELHAKTHVGRVRAGNEDNYLVLDLATQAAWTGTDGEEPPAEVCRFEVGPKGVVLAVSDGMGGALAGRWPSASATPSTTPTSPSTAAARKTPVAAAWAPRSPAPPSRARA